jgi:hypothetical protein
MTQKDQKETIDLRVILKGKIAREFEALQQYYGLEARTEVIRLIIHEKYESMKREE